MYNFEQKGGEPRMTKGEKTIAFDNKVLNLISGDRSIPMSEIGKKLPFKDRPKLSQTLQFLKREGYIHGEYNGTEEESFRRAVR